MLKTYAPGFGLIGVLVALAFQINQMQSAISPLALCVAFGFLVANFAQWPAFAAPATKISSKTVMRIGVALLGAQVSVVSLKEIGLKGVITVAIVVTFTIFGILGLSKLFKMSGRMEGKPISFVYLNAQYQFLKQMSYQDRISELSLNPDRADVIIPATKIYLSAMKWSGASKIYVPKIGLSDGIIKSLFYETI